MFFRHTNSIHIIIEITTIKICYEALTLCSIKKRLALSSLTKKIRHALTIDGPLREILRKFNCDYY